MPPRTTAPQRRALLPFAVSSRLFPLSVRCGSRAPRRAGHTSSSFFIISVPYSLYPCLG